MNTRRISVRILKFFLCLAGLWLLLAISWVALPSDVPSDTDNSNALRRGDGVSLIYNKDTFYPFSDPTPAVRAVRYSYGGYMILDIKLEPTTEEANSSYTMVLGVRPDSIAFKFGGKEYVLPQQTIPLVIQDQNLGVNVSNPLTFTSRMSDDNCDLHLTDWINRADVALTCWWLRHNWLGAWRWYDMADTPIRIRTIPANRTIELWPESYYWVLNPMVSNIGTHILPQRRPDSPWNPPQMGPFTTIKLHGSNQVPVFTLHPTSLSPSKFYTFRMALLAPLALISYLFIGLVFLITVSINIVFRLFFVLGIFMGRLVTAIFGCIALLGIFWWFRAGRPHVPLRDLVEAIRDVINDNGRRGQIALPDDVEAQEGVTVSEEVTSQASSEQTAR